MTLTVPDYCENGPSLDFMSRKAHKNNLQCVYIKGIVPVGALRLLKVTLFIKCFYCCCKGLFHMPLLLVLASRQLI